VQPRAPQRPGLLREEDAVGRERQVADRRPGGQQPHKLGQIAAKEGLAPGEADPIDPQRGERIRQRRDLLEIQDALAWKPRIVRLRHAVLAAQVAAIRDRDPEAAERPVEPVENHFRHYP
jgi:hypothetical protein